MFSMPGRMLSIAMVSVVLSFLSTVWFANRRLDAIDHRVHDLATNANPSIERMSAARAELRRLAMHLHAYLEARSQGERIDRSDIDSAYDRMRQDYRAQVELPPFAGEVELTRKVDEAIAPLAVLTERVVREIDARHFREAHRRMIHEFHDAVESADDAMERLVDFNSAQAHQRVASIQAARASSALIGWVLSGCSVVLALLATLLAFRALRRHAQLVAERDHLLEARATEMEAFAYRVAHDLRNPLVALSLRIMAAEGQQPSSEQLQVLLAKLRARVGHMALIIDGLLEFAQAGASPEIASRADVAKVVDDVMEDVQPEAAAAGISVDIERGADSYAVACTPGVLSSVVSNLLRNAIKHAGNGGRSARQVVIRTFPRGVRLHVEVEDNGPGVPHELQERIFEPFVRATDSRVPGIGLGLSTVKRLVTAHGGQVGVKSEVGVGACFWFELPIAPSDSPQGSRKYSDPPLRMVSHR
jgi:signal transduction histidine kinase